MEGNPYVAPQQDFKKIGPTLFLVWLLLVNILYYAQFRDLAVARLPWLAHIWH